MPSVIEELTSEDVTLDAAHIRERVADWRRRLSNLYGDIAGWLSDFTSDQTDDVEMHEELMQRYGVPPIRLPILRLSDGRDELARFVPRGLWIIGANGRVNLFAQNGQFVIIDRADYYSPPRWEIAPSLHRRDTQPLSRETLLPTMQ